MPIWYTRLPSRSAVTVSSTIRSAGWRMVEETVTALLDRKSTRLNSSHTEIYTLSLHDALPIYADLVHALAVEKRGDRLLHHPLGGLADGGGDGHRASRSEEHTSELQSHRDLHSFPTRRSSDLCRSGTRACRREAR